GARSMRGCCGGCCRRCCGRRRGDVRCRSRASAGGGAGEAPAPARCVARRRADPTMVAPESGAAMDFAFTVDPDITRARTLPSEFYLDPAVHAATRERVFARTWQWLGDLGDVAAPGSLSPRELLPGHLDEPLLLSRDSGGTLRCLSNVCTHRGNLLVRAPCRADGIRCG